MAVVPKKTYSRTNELCSLSAREKENVDPFDELLSSPLKQDVQFKPLSFWGRKAKDLARKKISKNMKYGLYESNNSDDNSPNDRKKKHRLKFSNHEDKKLPLKKTVCKKNNILSSYFIKKNKSSETIIAVENTADPPCVNLGNQESHCSENANINVNKDSMINSFYEGCDGLQFVSVRKHYWKQSCKSEPGSGFNIIENEKSSKRKFKICEDFSAEKETLNVSDEMSICTETEESENLEMNLSNYMEKTLMPLQEDCDNLKFFNEKTHLNSFYENNKSLRQISTHLKESNENLYEILNENNSSENLTFKMSEENVSVENLRKTDNRSTYNDAKDLMTSAFYFNDDSTSKSFSIQSQSEYVVDDASTTYSDEGASTTYTDADASTTYTDADASTTYTDEDASTTYTDKDASTTYTDKDASTTYTDADASTTYTDEDASTTYTDEDTSKTYTNEEDLIDATFCGCEIMGKTFSCLKHATVVNEEMKEMSTNEFWTEGTLLDNSNFVCNNTSNLEDLIQKLVLEQDEYSVTGAAESSMTSDNNSSSLTDEESGNNITLQHDRNNTVTTGSDEEKKVPHRDSFLKGVSHLTTEISHLAISSKAPENFKPETERLYIPEKDATKDAGNNSVCKDLRNVTTKRKYHLNVRYQRGIPQPEENRHRVNPPEEILREENNPEREWELDETFGQPATTDTTGFDWNRTVSFANPIFESTRLQDISSNDTVEAPTQSEKMASLMEESRAWLDHSYALKSGKKWLRSVSVLKQIRNGTVTGDGFESSRIKGRKFESFVRDVLEMQNGKAGWSTSMADLTNTVNRSACWVQRKKPFSYCVKECCSDLEAESSLKDVTFNSSIFSMSCSDGTVLEEPLINHSIKIIHPNEKPSAFGLKVPSEGVQGECSVREERSSISGRDFVLLQCGQDDVLPFEEYFNERTLKDCKKIGEGVYGEVFMSANVVIKIIPIEGSDKVNGEPQKTFEEILSEVVIALKLSNLRNGEKNRTHGFSEVKRCWCVKGRYPKYLLRLWDEYDRLGNGSENDSPIMFKEDQLYIILELGNGGKDLENFLFNSASQSLSIFVQTVLSLAAAEKAFEFEHRDLHWGNVLVSETKDKFVTVILDNVEYKIPSKGVKVCIIDFTLSRIYHEGFCIFNDLSVDPSLFTSEGDYQFEIYRMMLREVRNDWSLFRPKTNIFWLHYMLDKMINMARYKYQKTKLHKKCEKELKILKSKILDFKDSADFGLSESLSDVMKSL